MALLFSDLASLTAKSENKIGFSTSEKVRISSRFKKIYISAAGGIPFRKKQTNKFAFNVR